MWPSAICKHFYPMSYETWPQRRIREQGIMLPWTFSAFDKWKIECWRATDIVFFSLSHLPAWAQQENHLRPACSYYPGCCGCIPGSAAVNSAASGALWKDLSLRKEIPKSGGTAAALAAVKGSTACLLAKTKCLILVLRSIGLRGQFFGSLKVF